MNNLKNLLKLNARQQMFVAEYIIDFNATRSAKAAGYSKKQRVALLVRTC